MSQLEKTFIITESQASDIGNQIFQLLHSSFSNVKPSENDEKHTELLQTIATTVKEILDILKDVKESPAK